MLLHSRIPQSWTEAYISLIPKPNTDKTLIQNYRPISLLNVDYKIFATILVERLRVFLSRFIHQDQNGFLPHRHLRDNLRVILNTLEFYETHPDKPMVMIFLDAQKAFDRVNWNFIMQQLEVMGLGSQFTRAV